MDSHLAPQLDEIKREAEPIHPKKEFTSAELAYLAYYELDLPNAVNHRFGYIDSKGTKIAVHYYEPKNPLRNVVICHGYYDHTGTWKHAILALLNTGNSVVIYDHPGHGLSYGDRATVADFDEYVDVYESILAECSRLSPLPFALAGHSMGCAVMTDYLLHRNPEFKAVNIVFLAPLIRPAAWDTMRLANSTLGRFLKSVPRVLTENSSNTDYLEFVRTDPLHHNRVPFEWTRSLSLWNRRVGTFPPAPDRPLSILQGAQDKTVNWQFNLSFLKQKFPNTSVCMFAEGKHQLLNEAEPLRSQVIEKFVSALKMATTSEIK